MDIIFQTKQDKYSSLTTFTAHRSNFNEEEIPDQEMAGRLLNSVYFENCHLYCETSKFLDYRKHVSRVEVDP